MTVQYQKREEILRLAIARIPKRFGQYHEHLEKLIKKILQAEEENTMSVFNVLAKIETLIDKAGSTLHETCSDSDSLDANERSSPS